MLNQISRNLTHSLYDLLPGLQIDTQDTLAIHSSLKPVMKHATYMHITQYRTVTILTTSQCSISIGKWMFNRITLH